MPIKVKTGFCFVGVGVVLPILVFYSYIGVFGFKGAMDTGPVVAVLLSIPVALVLIVIGIVVVILSIRQNLANNNPPGESSKP